MNFSSKLLEQAVEEFGRLPGIGKKTALRLVLHLLQQNEQEGLERQDEIFLRRYGRLLGSYGTCGGICLGGKRK